MNKTENKQFKYGSVISCDHLSHQSLHFDRLFVSPGTSRQTRPTESQGCAPFSRLKCPCHPKYWACHQGHSGNWLLIQTRVWNDVLGSCKQKQDNNTYCNPIMNLTHAVSRVYSWHLAVCAAQYLKLTRYQSWGGKLIWDTQEVELGSACC